MIKFKTVIGVLVLFILANSCKDKDDPTLSKFSGQFDYYKSTHGFKAASCTSIDTVSYTNPDWTPTNGQPKIIIGKGYDILLHTEIDNTNTSYFDGGTLNFKINVQSVGFFDNAMFSNKWGMFYYYGWNGITYGQGLGSKNLVYCEITKLDTENKRISGKFQIIDKQAGLTDSLAVMNGVFNNVEIK